MQLLFDEDLVEAVVFLAANGTWAKVPALQARRFHLERERIYKILDGDDRNAAFFRLHLDWFREWGAEKFLQGIVAEFPLLSEHLAGLGFRKARTKMEEGAELFVSNEAGRRGIVAIRAERFTAPAGLTRLLHHELMHVQDMIDPAFEYSPSLRLVGPATATERPVRDRYRLLWDVTIDGRLTARGQATDVSREQRQGEFERAFAFWTEERRAEVFEQCWTSSTPKHGTILALATDPRGLAHADEPLPGGACPLCNFPTFIWADVERLDPRIPPLITAEFPTWQPAQGVCSRCIETYEALSSVVSEAVV